MDRYHVYQWIVDKYILIDRETRDLYFFSTNYQNKMAKYHLDNPTKESVSRQKIDGLIRRSKRYMDMHNTFAIDKYIYHLLMNDEQRDQCSKSQLYMFDLGRKVFITSGNDFATVIKNMQEIVNGMQEEAAVQ